ncbi:MAG: hypothetical protein HZC44_00440 [Geobacter sp.]|nr:hypothetical protein [Geobacter sp.]
MCEIDWAVVAEFSKQMLTPLIAIVATYIAWQQWNTNKQKLILDRYDRRLKVYEEVIQILSIITRDAKASYDDLIKFRRAVSEADFLFEPEIMKYIDEIYQRGVQLEYWNKQYRDYTQAIPDGYNHQKVCDSMHAELTWLTAQFEPAKQKFKKYLDVSK